MKKFTNRFFLWALAVSGVLLTGCSFRQVTTAWKTEHILPVTHSRLLVVSILPDEDSLERKKIEASFTATLLGLGYEAVSAIDEFGAKGLANLGEAETYTKLAAKGIDAVITVALVNRSKETDHQPVYAHAYRSTYYYNRIWEYKNTLTQPDKPGVTIDKYYWEGIFFDISTLEALCVVQTRSSVKAKQVKLGDDLARQMVHRMVREKMLKKKANRKAF
jgi:hypothetical protein